MINHHFNVYILGKYTTTNSCLLYLKRDLIVIHTKSFLDNTRKKEKIKQIKHEKSLNFF